MTRRDLIVLSLIPAIAFGGLVLLIILMVTGHAAPFHPIQLRTV